MLIVLGGILAFAAIIVLLVLGVKLAFTKSPDKVQEQHKGEQPSIFVKKYPEADITEHSSTFVGIGMIFSLAVMITAFSWPTYDKVVVANMNLEAIEEIEVEPPQTLREPPPPPPPPPPEIVVVEDEEIIEEEPEFEIPEIEEETVIDIPEVEEEEVVEDEIFKIVEDMPEFPGGQAGLLKYLGGITYPPIARENDIEGTVYIQFVVDKTGAVTQVTVARSSKDKILDEAALSHVKKMPKWAPGKQRGKPVRVQYVVPIRFKLG